MTLSEQTEATRDIVRFAKVLERAKELAEKMIADNEHLEYFLCSGIGIEPLHALQTTISEIEKAF